MKTAVVVSIAFIGVLSAQTGETARLERLVGLARVWGDAYVFHPKVLAPGIDWPAALIEAVPQVESSRTPTEYREALDRMLAKLRDPLTAVQLDQKAAAVGPRASSRLLGPGFGYIDLTEPRNYGSSDFDSQLRKLIADLGDIQRLVVDLRWRSVGPGKWLTSDTDWLRMFYTRPVAATTRVARQHEGWSERGTRAQGGYEQRWTFTPSVKRFVPDRPLSIKAVFLTNYPALDWLDEELGALQTCGHAVAFEPIGALPGLALMEGLTFNINMRPAISSNGTLGLQPDVTLPSLDDFARVDDLARLANRDLRNGVTPFSPFLWAFADREAQNQELAREERLYGLFKSWVVLRYFFGQQHLADPGWMNTLHEWIPRVEAATSRDAYYDILAQWTVPLKDSHVSIGAGPAPVRFVPAALAFVEGKLIVRQVAPDAGDLQVGDEILSFDGVTVAEFERHWKARISLSTPQAFNQYYIFRPVWGLKDSHIELKLVRDGRQRTVRARRTTAVTAMAPEQSSYRLLADDIGYVKLARIFNEVELDDALAALSATRGLVLDMRGYPGTGLWYQVASRLLERPMEVGSSEVPLVYAGQQQGWRKYTYLVQPHGTVQYRKPVVMLINDMAISAAEAIIAAAKSTGKVKLVGSPTNGANGNTSRVSLPGGGDLVFDVARHFLADGSSSQNVGIQPDVFSTPTIAGIKAGRDEVLERGLEVLKAQRP